MIKLTNLFLLDFVSNFFYFVVPSSFKRGSECEKDTQKKQEIHFTRDLKKRKINDDHFEDLSSETVAEIIRTVDDLNHITGPDVCTTTILCGY